MFIRPVGDRFTAEVLDDEVKNDESGFIVVSKSNSKPMKARVIEISEEFNNTNLNLKVGDIVLLPKTGTTGILVGKNQKKYQLCNRLDMIGIL